MIRVKAINLLEGDVLHGPALFTENGTVKSTTVVDNGVQINYEGGTRITRAENYEFDVERPGEEPPAA